VGEGSLDGHDTVLAAPAAALGGTSPWRLSPLCCCPLQLYSTGYLWDVASAQKAGQLAGLHGDDKAAISPDGRTLAVASVAGASVWLVS